LGNGFQEVIYQRALAIELERAGLKFEREKNMPIYYDEFRLGRRRVDFFVEECIMVELKAIIQMDDSNLAQAFNYLEAYKMEVGLLINFGARSLQWKRVHKHYDQHPKKFNQANLIILRIEVQTKKRIRLKPNYVLGRHIPQPKGWGYTIPIICHTYESHRHRGFSPSWSIVFLQPYRKDGEVAGRVLAEGFAVAGDVDKVAGGGFGFLVLLFVFFCQEFYGLVFYFFKGPFIEELGAGVGNVEEGTDAGEGLIE
jgi:GxxExxY protein